METITVKMASGSTRSVTVVLSDCSGTPDFPCVAPHTALSAPTACIDRGSNFHGSLAEDFYVVTDNHWEPCHVVLWIGDNGSQADDDQPRLCLAAWADFVDYWDNEKGEFNEAEAESVLLYAWIKSAQAAWSHHYTSAKVLHNCCKLDGGVVARIIDQACSGSPLSV